ncbi:MAG: heavy metal-associated domain-containing protein [Tepidisphaeraceae bacterium]
MADDVGIDQLAIIRIEGMHCHKCEQTIQKALTSHEGVHEVEVDFNSKQASVLYDQDRVTVKTLTDAVTEVGYDVTGFTTRHADRASQS